MRLSRSGDRLTSHAHREIERHLFDGAFAIDATAGNGFDTLFLAEGVGPSGRVLAFDLQAGAIDTARAKLAASDREARVEFVHAGHETMLACSPESWMGRVSAVVFNLGYLPQGDRALVTLSPTTILALDGAAELLRPGGILSVMIYPGHEGGLEEKEAVLAWADRLGSEWTAEHWLREGAPGHSPSLLLARRAFDCDGSP